MANNVTIDYDAFLDAIIDEFLLVKAGDDRFSDCNLVVEAERVFARRRDFLPNTIYIVVSWGSASTNFGASVLSASILCVSESKTMDVARDLLVQFAVKYNLTSLGDLANRQIYQTPTVPQAINEVGAGFRAYFSMTAAFIIGTAVNDVESLVYTNDSGNHDVGLLAFTESFNNTLAPQPTPETGGFAKSVAQYATYTFSFSTYPLYDSASVGLENDLNDLMYGEGNENRDFVFTLRKKNGSGFTSKSFKCVSVQTIQRIGELSTIQASFTL